jgi:hypothetical protein
MLGNLELHILEVNLITFSDSRFNCKIVFKNLVEVLQDLGYEVQRAETRQNGRGTPLAVRVLSGSRQAQIAIPVTIRIAHHQDRHFNANGFPSEWDKDVHKINPAHLVTIVHGRLAVEHAGAVISFPTIHVLNLRSSVLWGKQSDCIRAAEKRINKKGMTFNLPRYMRLNGPTFKAYALPEYDDFRVEAFRPDGSRWPHDEWLAGIIARVVG